MKRIVFLTLTLMLVCGIVFAQTDAPKDRTAPKAMNKEVQVGNQERPMQKCMDDLKLNDAQKAKWEELKINFEKTKNTLQAEIKNLRIDVQSALKDENYLRAKDLNKQIALKNNALADARVDFLAARMKELTSEQKAILKKNMKQFQADKPGPMHNRQEMKLKHSGMENCGECGECDNMDMPPQNIPPQKEIDRNIPK
ncbi:MAG: Spy/CpxP family protein refolding chaperone [Candidatus Cloacimonas sp.]